MAEIFWLIAFIVIAGTVWFAVWVWQQRATGIVEPRRSRQQFGDMSIRLPPD